VKKKKPQSPPVNKKAKQKVNPRSGEVRGLSNWVGRIVIVVLLIAIVATIAFQFFPEYGILDKPRHVVSTVITPIQSVFSKLTDSAVAYLRKLKYRATLEEEYQKLQEKVDELTDRAMRVETLEYELAQMKDLADEINRNRKMDGIKASVIGTDTSNYTFALTIDVGTNQGVENNLAVVVPGALIGYTYDVRENTCSVKGIIDADCSIAGLIESSRDQGTVQGTLSVNGKKECRMYYLSYTSLPRPGDRVVTSGVGMEFPKGIPIGHVRESTRGEDDSKRYVVIDPIANFEHLEYVIVYRYRPEKAEQADVRGSMSQSTYVPVPTQMPQATYLGQVSALTPTVEPEITPASKPEETKEPTTTGEETSEDDIMYIDKYQTDITQTPEPSDTPEPTDTPAPTFSSDFLTVEND
jgi:rod shape-determining protein MreC